MNEYEALATFFQDSQGEWWEQKENWLSDKRYGTWYGLRPDSAGHIEHLNLTDNRLQGKLHDSDLLRAFVNLKSFNVSSNILRGSIPKNIGRMQSLQELNLSWNGLEGPMPESLWLLSELRILKLDNNELCGSISTAICTLVKLKYLNLSCNKFEGTDDDVHTSLVTYLLLLTHPQFHARQL